jgi:peptidoglycan hydrolase CwlO-like protein
MGQTIMLVFISLIALVQFNFAWWWYVIFAIAGCYALKLSLDDNQKVSRISEKANNIYEKVNNISNDVDDMKSNAENIGSTVRSIEDRVCNIKFRIEDINKDVSSIKYNQK